MSDIINTAAEALKSKLGDSGFDGSVKFELTGEGVIRITEAGVTTEDGDADCTISADADTFKDMMAGELDPTAAFMTGKVKIDGDMGVAMKLSQVFA